MMKKAAFALLIGVSVMFCGCAGKAAEETPAKNANGTASVESSDDDERASSAYGAGGAAPDGDERVTEIKENVFVALINDIYLNASDYLGTTVKYEGLFKVYEVPETGERYYSVIRYGPGCCGVDANAGFEVLWNGEYPVEDEWVEVVGTLEEYKEDGRKYLRVALDSLRVLEVRGAESVQ